MSGIAKSKSKYDTLVIVLIVVLSLAALVGLGFAVFYFYPQTQKQMSRVPKQTMQYPKKPIDSNPVIDQEIQRQVQQQQLEDQARAEEERAKLAQEAEELGLSPSEVTTKNKYDPANNQATTVIDGVTYYHQPRPVPVPKYRRDLNDKLRWINAHNYYRTRHCAPPVVWDNKLEQLARDWAKVIAAEDFSKKGRDFLSHPTIGDEPRKYLSTDGVNVNAGQNLSFGGFQMGDGNVQYKNEIEDIVAGWYEEKELPNFSDTGMSYDGEKITFEPPMEEQRRNSQDRVRRYLNQNNLTQKCTDGLRYKYNESMQCSPGTGHFTQVVWKDSNRIGCAEVPVQWESDSKIWACNYAPGGNVVDESEYKNNVINPSVCGN